MSASVRHNGDRRILIDKSYVVMTVEQVPVNRSYVSGKIQNVTCDKSYVIATTKNVIDETTQEITRCGRF